jgi:hypothetical protein
LQPIHPQIQELNKQKKGLGELVFKELKEPDEETSEILKPQNKTSCFALSKNK